MPTEHDRLAIVERDSRDHARILGEIVGDQRAIRDDVFDLKQGNAIRAVEDRHLDERLDRIEASLKSVFGLGKWLLGAIGSVLVVAIVGFVLKGGPLG